MERKLNALNASVRFQRRPRIAGASRSDSQLGDGWPSLDLCMGMPLLWTRTRPCAGVVAMSRRSLSDCETARLRQWHRGRGRDPRRVRHGSTRRQRTCQAIAHSLHPSTWVQDSLKRRQLARLGSLGCLAPDIEPELEAPCWGVGEPKCRTAVPTLPTSCCTPTTLRMPESESTRLSYRGPSIEHALTRGPGVLS